MRTRTRAQEALVHVGKAFWDLRTCRRPVEKPTRKMLLAKKIDPCGPQETFERTLPTLSVHPKEHQENEAGSNQEPDRWAVVEQNGPQHNTEEHPNCYRVAAYPAKPQSVSGFTSSLRHNPRPWQS
jgi:hypothetical protein